MWKTTCGGSVTIVFVTLVLLYIITSVVQLSNGNNDWMDSVEIQINPDELGQLTLNDMKAFPVVYFQDLVPSRYLDVTSDAFKSNIFVALKANKIAENGTLLAEYLEFVPCS